MQIYAGKLFDPYTLQLLENQVITVSPESGLVLDVQPFSITNTNDLSGPQCIDLRHATVLPGFVDAHVHFFLHPYSEVSWEDQVTKESLVERTVRATIHARRTLMAGYTSVRDLGTEGAGDADFHLRKCMSGSNAMIPGPRYFCANRAIVPTGSYAGPKSTIHLNQEGIEGITGAEVADGEVECIKAVRRQIGAGADWIKWTITDYRFRSRMVDVSPAVSKAAITTFNEKELHAIVSTAINLGVKVAAHSAHWHARGHNRIASGPGVHSVEHGQFMVFDNETSKHLESRFPDDANKFNTIWVPTLAAYYTIGQGQGEIWESALRAFRTALERGVENIACGGDTGVFAHGDNALEMKLMARAGADWRKVLKWGTLGGWTCVRSMAWEGKEGEERLARVEELHEDARLVGDNEVPFGAVRRGFGADIIATSGDLENDFESAIDKSAIEFVMKGGRVHKMGGKELV
ncbi:uncharacterized protein LAESUDRAFT_659678 [Laetiporus sulphureus 93-53]|uniref:Amidohydrolase-related domain-containing protein n=1 Tax=Laetiporus sulphureus 93-53 TaxID=1314785 RepID=A0A165CVF9_9APHY|nr:uncharacterized protein LAESUDRAFT_659678 [Laetiporus sulphureus 93-53]KZT03501.1 hypothetical protein LAESUDRAFT_659678 [Laetiporus sulphureus 93-53]